MDCDVCIVGGGSGGIGAAIGAARGGVSVILIEKNHILGGTITMAWVHSWEPTCKSSPLCRQLWNRMRIMPGGAANLDYEIGSSRLGPDGNRNPGLPFEPWAFLSAVDAEMKAAGIKQILYNTTFTSCKTDGASVKSIRVLGPSGAFEIKAKVFIDATADIHVARMAGCEVAKGAEAKSQYNEPHAPDGPNPKELNAMNWCYRVRVGSEPVKWPDLGPFPKEAIRPSRHELRLPNGDIVVNPCGMVQADPGEPEEFARTIARARYLAMEVHRWTVVVGGQSNRILIGLAPEIGVRETWRLVGRYVLTEQDVVGGLSSQKHPDLIAGSDHPLDIHGSIHVELKQGYGIPFRCLQTKEYDNLLVSCRGSSFSHIAAGSCRLSRTMITIGEAAGAVAAAAIKKRKLADDIDAAKIHPLAEAGK